MEGNHQLFKGYTAETMMNPQDEFIFFHGGSRLQVPGYVSFHKDCLVKVRPSRMMAECGIVDLKTLEHLIWNI